MTLRIRCLLAIALIPLLNGCSSAAYYAQLADGQWQLLKARQPVAKVIADPQQPPVLRQHLANAQAARTFASQHLYLPDNQSYRLYADLKRPYVVWNVFATPEFSLNPVTQCFPIAGCVAYRGFYSLGAARGEAAAQSAPSPDNGTVEARAVEQARAAAANGDVRNNYSAQRALASYEAMSQVGANAAARPSQPEQPTAPGQREPGVLRT